MKFHLTIACDNSAFELYAGQEVARLLREAADRVQGQDPGDENVLVLPDVNGTNVLRAFYSEPLHTNYDPSERHQAYTNYPTWRVQADVENDAAFYEYLLNKIDEWLRGVPNMTPQTLGVNLKNAIRSIVEHPEGAPRAINRNLLDGLRKINFAHVNEEDLGDAWREIWEDVR